MQNVRIDVGAVWPDDGAEFEVDGDCAEHSIVQADLVEDRPPEQRGKIDLPHDIIGKGQAHPPGAEDFGRAHSCRSPAHVGLQLTPVDQSYLGARDVLPAPTRLVTLSGGLTPLQDKLPRRT